MDHHFSHEMIDQLMFFYKWYIQNIQDAIFYLMHLICFHL
ncbi:unnamed protein product [Schistosoma mattheei]|uniref:Uncharacterized protein n=2 Tax=Schistosoma TaxID=6181 RepID=A0A183JFT6_9TREM|nr:unnamed protein product [Schistosoma curassoni]VDP66204.1 unnamed protein product [Schistosoma mattheei]